MHPPVFNSILALSSLGLSTEVKRMYDKNVARKKRNNKKQKEIALNKRVEKRRARKKLAKKWAA